jgi:predicted nucleic acid-binding protein
MLTATAKLWGQHRSDTNSNSSALDIALHMNAGLYDSMYLSLAQREKCKFMAADERLIRALQGQT